MTAPHRKRVGGRRCFAPLSRPAEIIAAMRLVPLVKTYRDSGATIWALQNGREISASAARRLIREGRIVPRDGGLLAESEPQTYVIRSEDSEGGAT